MGKFKSATLLFLCSVSTVLAVELEIPDQIVIKQDALPITLKLPQMTQGEGELHIVWTDSFKRKVLESTEAVQVDGQTFSFSLPLAPAVALQNFLDVSLAINGRTVRDQLEFFVTPSSSEWDDYQIIMYYAYKPEQQPALRDVGITAGKISDGDTQRRTGGRRWYEHGYRFYCDQISTFFYAAYHTPAEKPKQRMQQVAEAGYQSDRSSKKWLYRQPCFHDPVQLNKALGRLREAVKAQKHLRPFFYAHTDEGGVGNLVEAIDFCFAPQTLAAMREWLMEGYGSVERINQEWDTKFRRLDEVVPYTTDEMMARGGDNLSPWADHRTFMNISFADVIRAGTRAVESVDATARAGLVGCQMPGAFGGYDYWLLSKAMTAIEPYNIGNNREIWRSLAPEKPAVTTAFGFGDMEIWRLWYQMLHGDLGIIIYDEKFRYLNPDGTPTSLGAGIAPTYKELTGGLAKQLHYMERVNDPIAIHYSHPSVNAHWMIEARTEGQDWIERGSASERTHSDFLRLRESAVKLLEDNLLQYTFVAYGQLENGEFDGMNAKVLMLPQSIAMSSKEVECVQQFVERGGTVIADCRTALMDEHCKTLEKGRLDALFGIRRKNSDFSPGPPGLRRISETADGMPTELSMVSAAEPGLEADGAVVLYRDGLGTPAIMVQRHGKGKAIYLNALITDYHRWRLRPPEGDDLRQLINHFLFDSGVVPQYEITDSLNPDGRTIGLELYPYISGKLRILALHRNYQLRVSELGPPEYQQQDWLAKPMSFAIDLGTKHAVYDQRAGKLLGQMELVIVDLARYEPTVLTILPEPLEALSIEGSDSAKRGDLVTMRLALKGPCLGDTHALRVSVRSPDKKLIPVLTKTLVAPNGQTVWKIPIALSDPPGTYTLSAKDVATGISAERRVTVYE